MSAVEQAEGECHSRVVVAASPGCWLRFLSGYLCERLCERLCKRDGDGEPWYTWSRCVCAWRARRRFHGAYGASPVAAAAVGHFDL
jgi:hypothetical protein